MSRRSGFHRPRRPTPADPDRMLIAESIKAIDEVEKDHILWAMERLEGDKPLVARTLGISLKTLYSKLNRYAEQEAIAS
jgi:DNA-binding NtrC family response regulator